MKESVDIEAIIECLDNFLTETGKRDIAPREANTLLEEKGLLRDDIRSPGLPLRNLLRTGKLPHAYQSDGKYSRWIIPHSGKREPNTSNCSNPQIHTAIVERCPDTKLYVGYVPGLPGAQSQGETLEELNNNLKEVIAMIFDDDIPAMMVGEFVGTQVVVVD